MHQGLLWKVIARTGNERNLDIAPSWSWASNTGSLEFCEPASVHYHRRNHYRLVDIHCDHIGSPFGPVAGGTMLVQGPMSDLSPRKDAGMSYSLQFHKSREMEVPTRGQKRDPYGFIDYPSFYADAASCFATTQSGKTFLFLLQTWHQTSPNGQDKMVSFHGLVLGPTGLKAGQFQRLVMLKGAFKALNSYLEDAKDPKLLQPEFYLHADADLGFAIEII